MPATPFPSNIPAAIPVRGLAGDTIPAGRPPGSGWGWGRPYQPRGQRRERAPGAGRPVAPLPVPSQGSEVGRVVSDGARRWRGRGTPARPRDSVRGDEAPAAPRGRKFAEGATSPGDGGLKGEGGEAEAGAGPRPQRQRGSAEASTFWAGACAGAGVRKGCCVRPRPFPPQSSTSTPAPARFHPPPQCRPGPQRCPPGCIFPRPLQVLAGRARGGAGERGACRQRAGG